MPFPRSLDRLPTAWREERRARRRQFRVEETKAEAELWRMLRNRRLIDAKFRRQVPIGRYVVDFYCHDRRLIVELDGGVHSEPSQIAHDQNRDTFLLSLGLRILRFPNEDLLESPEEVLQRIQEAITRR